MKYLSALILALLITTGYSQYVTDTVIFTSPNTTYNLQSKEVSGVVMDCYDCTFEDARVSSGNESYEVLQDPHEETSSMITFSDQVSQVDYYSGNNGGAIRIIFYHAPKIERRATQRNAVSTAGSDCKPEIVEPSEWRSDLQAPSYTPSKTNTTHIIVHHAATSNNISDPYSVVRNIYLHHTQTNGWSDIGYNYLIAPDGTVFQGRDSKGLFDPDYTIGAHMCGKNSGTMGVCLLGNFTSTEPTKEALESLYQLIAWKANKDNIDVMAASSHEIGPSWYSETESLNHVAGHREGCASGYTECPGDKFFPMMSIVRENSSEVMQSEDCEYTPEPTTPDPDEPDPNEPDPDDSPDNPTPPEPEPVDPLVYPNPTMDYFQANFEWERVAIFDVTEKLLLDEKYKGVNKIDISAYPKGLYIVQFFTEDKVEKFKLLKF